MRIKDMEEVGREQNLDPTTQTILRGINQTIGHINYGNVDWDRTLRQASLNRVLYLFSRNLLEGASPSPLLENLELIVSEGDRWLNELRKNLEFISVSFSQAAIPFLIIKTYRNLPYVTFDVDVLVRPEDFGKAERVLQESGAKLEYFSPKKQTNIEISPLLKIDLHKDLYWQDSTFLDLDFVWKQPRTQKIEAVACPIPNLEAELALTIAHTLYERLHLTLLEFLFIKSAWEQVKWETISFQAIKHGWERAFCRFISIFNQLDQKVYPPLEQKEKDLLSSFQENGLKIPKVKIRSPVSFPYLYPALYGLEVWGETLLRKRCPPLYEGSYYLFALFRYHLSNKQRVPMYDHWFSFDRLKW